MKVKTWLTTGKYTLYATLLLVGVGEIMAAQTGVEITIALADMAVVSSDIVINEALATTLAQTADGQKFLDRWNKFALIYGGVSVYTRLSGLSTELNSLTTKLNNPETDRIAANINSKLAGVETEAVVSGAGKSIFGQNLDEIGEVLGNGLVKGKYSRRTFDPNKVGDKILNLSYDNALISKNGIDDIKMHLKRLDPSEWNDAMIKRLDDIETGKIQATDFDKKFYTHELRELERTRASGFSDTHKLTYDEWNDLHSATLEDYKLFENMVYQGQTIKSLYHPSVQK